MPSPATAWTLAGHRATCHCPPATAVVSARLDLDDPAGGIDLRTAAPGADVLLAVDLGALHNTSGRVRLTDHWVRGADVAAVYEPVDPRRLRATAMWRAHRGSSPGPLLWELVLSAQTSLVESDASLTVACTLAGDVVPWDVAGALLVRRPTSSALVAVHPADARGMTVTAADGRIRTECPLFSTTIEKGVLLRGRVLAGIGPAAGDIDWARAAIAAFAAAEPPLTT